MTIICPWKGLAVPTCYFWNHRVTNLHGIVEVRSNDLEIRSKSEKSVVRKASFGRR